jgi:NADH-quinone oxidoreductase subunit L
MTWIATGIGLAGLGVAWVLWAKGASRVPERVAASMGGVYRLLLDKYRIDELYQAVIIRPLMWLSDGLLHKFVDRIVIDTVAVGIPVMLVKGAGAASRSLQTGNAQWYAGVITLGIALFLAIYGYGA